ncbi:hypothetical protein HZ994_18610 [Akkermansiaceae bacterium]|nr:hypothetical protein HZ994_18610 [Akkermansiaceae bacterium]
MAKLKQGNLFEEDAELLALRERERNLEQAHKDVVQLPARLERERRERDSTMPPMAEIREREQIRQFERSLSRGQIENTLRAQRQSLAMMLLLATATVLMLFWAYRIAFN